MKLVNTLKQNSIRLIIAILAAVTITLSIKPMIEYGMAQAFPQDIYVEVISANAVNGGAEVWIASTNSGLGLASAPQNSSYNGICEFRLAATYGYSYDFLVSYGNNIGSVIHIKNYSCSADGLIIYKFCLGARIRISCNDYFTELDTYSETDSMENITLNQGNLCKFALYAVSAVIAVALTMLMYFVISRLWNDVSKKNVAVQGRNPALDLVKTIAAFLVVAVHSFLHAGYYDTPIDGEIMYLLTFFRWMALSCVPLFMLATGYLCIQKTDFKKTIRSFVPGLIFFVIFTIFKVFGFYGAILNIEPTRQVFLDEVFGMSGAWYIEMYVGLLLIMPFMNILWAHLDSKYKKLLLTALILLTTLSTLGFSFLPDYWVALYPICYYFIGAYLKENPIALSGWKTVLVYLLFVFSQTLCTIFSSRGVLFRWDLFGNYSCNYNAFTVVASSVLLFAILANVKIKNKYICGILRFTSNNTLGVYLIAGGFIDGVIYKFFTQWFATPQEFAKIQLWVVILDFIISLLIAAVLSKIISAVIKLIKSTGKKNTADV